ncbi:Crp/Fnr family transcriptional regulator [Candidatus Filomicrobium marinum]|nr:Crp/Fnr family transcriptional regulator [Candidatus Filomicrobium marinum]
MSDNTAMYFDFDHMERLGARSHSFDAGEKIFLQNEHGNVLYVVRTGRVEVITFGKVLEKVGANGIVGEIAFVDGGPRSAAALASEKTDVMVLDKDAFSAIIREDPDFALHVMRVMAERLRRLNLVGHH